MAGKASAEAAARRHLPAARRLGRNPAGKRGKAWGLLAEGPGGRAGILSFCFSALGRAEIHTGGSPMRFASEREAAIEAARLAPAYRWASFRPVPVPPGRRR